MIIEIDYNEVIPLEKFELGWRFDDLHNSGVSDNEKSEVIALSETESKRLNKIIDYYEIESNRFENILELIGFLLVQRVKIT